jgi:nucleoid DNA-binding protein
LQEGNITLNTSAIIKELSLRLQKPQNETKALLDTTLDVLKKNLGKNRGFILQNFGSFNIKKRERRKGFNPLKNSYIILPPKMVLVFKPSSALKEKVKSRRVE